MHKTINWTDKDGNSCYVLIADGLGGSGNLTPATSPFITMEDETNDPMLPIRTSTAKISIIATWEEVEQIINSRPMSMKVTFYQANVAKWRGYISNNTYTQDYKVGVSTYTFDAIDRLEALKSFDMLTPDDEATITTDNYSYTFDNSLSLIQFRRYIAECLVHVDVNDVLYLCFEKSYVSDLTLSNTYTLSNMVNRRQFLEPHEDGWKPMTCYDWMRNYCILFGFTLRLIGDVVYFSRNLSTAKYSNNVSLRSFFNGTTPSGSASLISSSFNSHGTNHTIDTVAAAASLEVDTQINPSTSDAMPGWEFGGAKSYQHLQGSQGLNSQWYYRDMNLLSDIIPYWYRYEDDSWIESNQVETYDRIDRMRVDSASAITNPGAGCAIVTQDYFFTGNGDESPLPFDPGSCPTNKSDDKGGLEFHTCALLTQSVGHNDASANAPFLNYSEPILTFRGKSPISVERHSGQENFPALQLDIEVYFNNSYNSAIPRIVPFINENAYPYLVCKLKIGDAYYTNSGTSDRGLWGATEGTFKIRFDKYTQYSFNPASIRSNGMYRYGNTAQGYGIPLDYINGLSGVIEFSIMGWQLSNGVVDSFNTTPLYIRDFSMKYCPALDEDTLEVIDDKQEYQYIKRLPTSGDEYFQQLFAHSNRDGQSSYGQIYYSNGTPVGLYPNSEDRPETILLNMMNAQYVRINKYLTIETKEQGHSTPCYYMQSGSAKYTPISAQTDWRSLVSRVKLIKL